MTDTIGHNFPPPDLLTGDALIERLHSDHLGLADRVAELAAGLSDVPLEIADDPTANDVSDLLKMCQTLNTHAEAARKAEKDPYWNGGKTIDGFFSKLLRPVDDGVLKVRTRLTFYLRQKAERERLERERIEREAYELEQRRRAEAERLAAEARTQADLDRAITAENEADHAKADALRASKLAEASNAELSRVRGSYGSLGSLRTTWVFSGLDRDELDLEALRKFIPVSGLESAVNAFIKAGGRELRGVRIHESTSAVVR